jgi:alkanesulfonate monooxygenase SsuD/methylene tetrahydromethanopterin reductase-like flavin-dependent oxidoreductase (luciferase family)
VAPSPRVAEIKLYIDHDDARARHDCRLAVGSRMIGLFQRDYTAEDYARLSIPLEDVERLFAAVKAGASGPALAELITDPMVDALFVAGDPARCREQLAQVYALAESSGFDQIMFSELGEDVDQALDLLCSAVLPAFPGAPAAGGHR